MSLRPRHAHSPIHLFQQFCSFCLVPLAKQSMAAPFEGQERIQATSTPTLLRLPQEMVLQMLSYLTVQDISMFSLVSMCCAQLCGKEQVWSALLCQCVWPRPGAVAWAGKDCKQVCMQLFRWPPPQHGWFFDTQFTVDHYGSIDLRKGVSELLGTWISPDVGSAQSWLTEMRHSGPHRCSTLNIVGQGTHQM